MPAWSVVCSEAAAVWIACCAEGKLISCRFCVFVVALLQGKAGSPGGRRRPAEAPRTATGLPAPAEPNMSGKPDPAGPGQRGTPRKIKFNT